MSANYISDWAYVKAIIAHIKEKLWCRNISRFRIVLYSSIHQVPAGHWDSLVKKCSVFLQKSYLSALEDVSGHATSFQYALLYDNDKPVGVANFQVLNFDEGNIGSSENKDNAFVLAIKENLKSIRNRPLALLLCGNPFVSGQHGFCFSDEVSKEEAFHGLSDAIYNVKKGYDGPGKIVGILVKDFDARAAMEARELIGYGYHEFEADQEMAFIIPEKWKTYDDYLDALSSKYRIRAKSVEKKSQALIRKNFSREDIAEHLDRLAELYFFVHNKADFRLGTFNIKLFLQLKENLGERFFVEGYFIENRLVGFISGFIFNHVLDTYLVGIDYNYNVTHKVYSSILYDYVRLGIESRVKRINYGRTALEIKSTVGAFPVDLACYIKSDIPLSGETVNSFLKYMKSSSWIQRIPFKKP